MINFDDNFDLDLSSIGFVCPFGFKSFKASICFSPWSSKDVRLNTTHFFISKIPNRRELFHSSDISTKDFENIYRKCTAEPYLFFVNDTKLASVNPLMFKKSLFNIECNSSECNSII